MTKKCVRGEPKMQSLRSHFFYKLYKLFGSPFDVSTPLTEQRENLERQSRFSLMPKKVIVEPISIGNLYAEWIGSHLHANNKPVLLYLHGGGYSMGSCNTHRALVAQISVAGQTPALLIEYRLAPEHPFPAALENAIAAYHYLLEQGNASRRIIVVGDSAGGGLAVALTLHLRDENERLPDRIVCISPWADLSLSGETMQTCADTDPLLSRESSKLHADWYVGQQDPKSPKISPVFADMSGLPPMLIQVGEHEILRNDAERLTENARLAGTDVTLEIWEGMWHVWHALAGYMPESQSAIERIGMFITDVNKSLGQL